FFFQAEDGIRDFHVTGVQTCALPIWVHLPTGQHVVVLKEKTNDRYLPIWIGTFEANAIAMNIQGTAPERPITHDLVTSTFSQLRSEERRVGKECRSRRSGGRCKKEG